MMRARGKSIVRPAQAVRPTGATRARRARGGLTLPEALVAISVIAILLAITVPAVMHVRESSRRAQCAAHLGGLGKALHAYEAAHRKFPPAVHASHERVVPPHVYLLPFLDQSPLFDQVMGIPISPPGAFLAEGNLDTPGVREIATIPVATFLCPSDPGSSGCNYRVCLGPDLHAVEANPLHPDSGGRGPFTAIKEYPSGEFRDGLSNTVAMSERLKSDADPTRFNSREDVWFTGVLDLTGTVPPLDGMVSLCASLSVEPLDYYPYTGLTWMFASYHHTWYNHAVTPNFRISDCSSLSGGPMPRGGAGVYKASSRHPGGVNVLFVDGRVQFTSDSIDLGVWRALSTRRGDEIVAMSGI